jgi:outer membrane protein OmpA-like peptidoglycan-associated protein
MSLDPALVRARARAAIDSLKQAVESQRILFGSGSAELDQEAVAKLTSVASRYRLLEDEAARSGASPIVQLTGRTDPSGADGTNAALADRRVQSVARWFESSGIAISHIASNPIAATQPLPGSDSSSMARINRSVSFKVTFPPAQKAPGALR